MEYYFQNGLAASTQRSYNSGKRRYLKFCQIKGSAPVPASEHQLCQFVAFLANEKLCHNTIKSYLAAIRHLHIAEGAGDPGMSNMPRLEQVVKGVKATQVKEGKKVKARLPITPELLLRMKQAWSQEQDSRDIVMLWAAVSVCFFGFLRAGEICVPSDSSYDEGAHLNFKDVSVDSMEKPSRLKIRIKASKTDPFRQGVDIFVGRTGNELCPVAAALAYMVQRGPGPGPLFQFQDGKPLTRQRFVARVREALTSAGVDCSAYSGHSFRSGAATTAAKCGVSDAMIKMLGRWKSSAYQLYIKTPRDHLARISMELVKNMQ